MATPESNGARWPNLFVVGAGRCGTTSLWHYLGQHPDIYMSEVKETYYLTVHRPAFQPAVTTEAAYLRLFERAGSARLVGEATPTYFRDPDTPARIHAVSPDAQIVVVVRHPVERAWSAFWHARRYRLDTRPFAEVLDGPPFPGSSFPPYVSGSRYAEPVRRYRSVFGDRVSVLVFEELFADLVAGMRNVFGRLGVDPGYAARLRPHVLNAYSQPRNAIATRIYAGRAIRFLAKRAIPSRLHHRVERVALARGAKPPLDPELRRRVVELCADDVRELEDLLGRRLPWNLE